jgi:2,4-dienoyl-CoA reductase-like NADH-dependent reductase (Old Yellow Enzyme family)
MNGDIIFEPLSFRNLTVKNRILRSNMSGRFDNYDGSGTQARINWEEKFARGGVGAILSAHVPVTIRGRIFPNYATIDRDESIPFWRRLGERMHEYDCKFILQLSHAGRQQDMPGIENLGRKAQSSTSRPDPLHGFECQAMTREEIKDAVRLFADGARRAREAGLDGVETHSAHGYLIT